MTPAQIRLQELIGWFDKSSAQRRTPNGGALLVGQYAPIVPLEADEALPTDFHDMSAVLFVLWEQVDGLWLPDADLGWPASQDRPEQRLWHVLWRMEQGTLPSSVVVPLLTPDTTLQAALDAAAPVGVDLDEWPVLFMPLWHLPEKHRDRIAAKLPMLQ